jgi:hypothetical protein
MFSAIQKWASFVRFSHTVFALPLAMAAMMVAALAWLAHVWTDSRRDGLRADVRDGFQPNC